MRCLETVDWGMPVTEGGPSVMDAAWRMNSESREWMGCVTMMQMYLVLSSQCF